MSKFPQKLERIAKLKDFRDYCLNPCGYQIRKTMNFSQQRQIQKYIDFNLTVHRGDKPLADNVIAFKMNPYKYNLSKPEIKQYLQKLYGLDILKIHTLNQMGRVKRNQSMKWAKTRSFKKVYVELNQEVDKFYQKFDKS